MKILRELLNGEKTTGQLCHILGYVDRGIPQYNVVNSYLNSLYRDKLLKRKKRRMGVGAPKTFWKIREDIETVKKLYFDYPSLRMYLIKSDYYQRMIPQLIEYFEHRINSIPDEELIPPFNRKFDSEKEKKELIKEERKRISLKEDDKFMLRDLGYLKYPLVLEFILKDRTPRMLQLNEVFNQPFGHSWGNVFEAVARLEELQFLLFGEVKDLQKEEALLEKLEKAETEDEYIKISLEEQMKDLRDMK
jgi:hypothetical protein